MGVVGLVFSSLLRRLADIIGVELENQSATSHLVDRSQKITSLEASCAFIQARLKNCDESPGHEKCRMKSTALPKRLLDVQSIQPDVRICEPDPGSRYIALSYCWGDSWFKEKAFRSLRSTLSSKMDRIVLGDLPLLYQDVVAVARQLGISHIWIDALCIVQDDTKEKDEEMAKMGDYYRNADFTVAASSAAGVQKSFIRCREDGSEWAPQKFSVLPRDFEYSESPERRQHFYSQRRREQEDLTRLVLEGPLSKRAWCYQENVLSRRVAHFDEVDDIWECQKEVAMAERVMRGNDLVPNTIELKATPLCRLLETGKWNDMVETYTSRYLSVSSDKLPAISAVAAQKAQDMKSQYLARLMGTEIKTSLWWHRRQNYPLPSAGDGLLHRDKDEGGLEIRPPSWSWASVIGPVSCATVPGSMVTVLDASCKVADENLSNNFGKVLSGAFIKIKAPTFTAKLRFTEWKSMLKAYSIHRNGQSGVVIPDAHIAKTTVDQQTTGKRCEEASSQNFQVPVLCVVGDLTIEDPRAFTGRGTVLWLLVLGIDERNPQHFTRLGIAQVEGNLQQIFAIGSKRRSVTLV